jgi:hypothetical protein
MTREIVAFGMPFITLLFMGGLAYGIARYNRRSKNGPKSGDLYIVEASKVSWHFQGDAI